MAEPTFKRDPAAEARAMRELGLTAAEIEARGGVNRAGYYGDAFRAAAAAGTPYLSDEQYFAALEGKRGTDRGAAVNLATAKNRYDIFISQGLDPAEASARSGYDPATNSLTVAKTVSSSGAPSGSSAAAALAAQQAAQAAAGRSAVKGSLPTIYCLSNSISMVLVLQLHHCRP